MTSPQRGTSDAPHIHGRADYYLNRAIYDNEETAK